MKIPTRFRPRPLEVPGSKPRSPPDFGIAFADSGGKREGQMPRLTPPLSRKGSRGRRIRIGREDEDTTREAERRTDRRRAPADRHDAATEDRRGGGQAPAEAPLAPGHIGGHAGGR